MNKLLILSALSCLIQFTGVRADTSAPQEKPATQLDSTVKETMEASAKAAEAWLKYIDNGAYGESWEHAALTLQFKIPKASWVGILDSTRRGYGKTLERKILEQIPKVDPEGLPKGNYMVIFYATKFSSQNNGNELVTLIQTDSGEWKVLTYLVK